MNRTVLKGASTHNLKNVSIELDAGELVAVTGVSGAGKSSLCLDTLYAEGQRRFVESFSPYARQFLERHTRPPIESLEPVAAAVAVDRRAPVKSSRSTVATMADVEPYLSALFLREALPVCPTCEVTAERHDAHSAVHALIDQHEKARATIVYPHPVSDTATYLEAREKLIADGYRRLHVAGRARDIDEVRPSEVFADGGMVEVILDRVTLALSARRRIQEALERAWARSDGFATVISEGGERRDVRCGLVCPSCARTFRRPRAGLFSYQSPVGACPECRGFGRVIGLDLRKVVPDETKSLSQGALRCWTGKSSAWERRVLARFCERAGIDRERPWNALSEKERDAVLRGEGRWRGGKYPGVRPWFKWLESKAYKMHVRVFLARYRSYDPCPECHGKRLNPQALSYRVDDLDLASWHRLELRDARDRLSGLGAQDPQGEIVRRELTSRLRFLCDVGLGYLTLDRQARTLSGGEAQRVSLTAALGGSLTGALVVLDEPTVGLHVQDIPPLVATMQSLAAQGNCVMVVEHDASVIESSDRVVELGPGAGHEGGQVLFSGSPEALKRRKDLPTGRALALADTAPAHMPKPAAGWLTVHGARANNLQNIDVEIPLGNVCALTGPSGSGKTTLADEIVVRQLTVELGLTQGEIPGAHDRIEGYESLRAVVLVDQSPLGRTSRGNAATYTKAWDRIRTLFGVESAALQAGLNPSSFSFNLSQGRCDACSGQGYETVEMQFLADVSLLCPVCSGKRFKREVLEVRHRGHSVAEVLEMTVEEVHEWLGDEKEVHNALQPLRKLGLGYLPLGQPLSTLSGGEAQRLKLARALRGAVDRRLFVLDEPSAGLHPADIESLVACMRDLVDRGASVLVVEHDLALIRAADWIVDLGPGAGRDGGHVVVQGTPESIARGHGATARALRGERATVGPTKPYGPRRARANRTIGIHNAREHNLRDVSCEVPRDQLVVVTGPSGSGKSSLVFDVLFAEGQRRFLETLTPYARQFLPTLPRPDVDRIVGLPPSVALEQRRSRSAVNSTVATVTEVAHYLRLLFAKVGTPHCPRCDVPIAALTEDGVWEQVRGTRGTGTLFAPVVQGRKGTYLDVFTAAARAGFERARVDGAMVSTDRPPRLRKTKEHDIDLVIYEGSLSRVGRETLSAALQRGRGSVRLQRKSGTEVLLSTARACPRCGLGIPELDPRWFSFNTKQGKCDTCEGTGLEYEGSEEPCEACDGSRLAPIPRAVRLKNRRYHDVVRQPVTSAQKELRSWHFDGDEGRIAGAAFSELLRRIDFLSNVGLGYLGLDRDASTLSGGEMQRLRLSAQLGAGLTGAMYVLDEPTIGLHPRDTARLLGNLRSLVGTGSTVVVVEHDADTIRAADHIIDLGPGGGVHGGRVVAEGKASDVLAAEASPTAQALRNHLIVTAPDRGRPDRVITLRGASAHNLKNIDVRIPAQRLTVVAGVSGSGKSTLVERTLYPAVRRALRTVSDDPLEYESLDGANAVARAARVDQLPIGRTPRSVPATFLGVWDEIRRLYASLPEAQVKGFKASRFSFNSGAGGRCPECKGQGVTSHEMSFLPDVVTPCDVCQGTRFEPSTLEVRYRGVSVGEVLQMTADEGADFFSAHPKIFGPLRMLSELGVGYVKLGQGSHTLSGGEAQRLKLAVELTATGHHRDTLYVLDEPTTGLHLSDVVKLVKVLHQLVERGDTLVVIEHHPDVIASADHVIELGPEGGDAGGEIVARGTVKDLTKAATATGKVLRDLLRPPRTRRARATPVASARGTR